jgi:hypothetical protein
VHGGSIPFATPGTFSATGKMITPRFFHTTTLLPDGRVLIAVGDSSYSGTSNAEASAELYDPIAGKFATTGSMTTPRDGHTASLLPNGKVLIAGGGPRISGAAYSLASAELYDPATGTFASTGNMNVERWFHTATALNNGKVLIAGGLRRVLGSSVSDITYPVSAELFDPSTGTFTATGDMNLQFADTSTLLSNGKVLITRGNPEGPPPYLSSAELYDPSTGTFAFVGYATVNHTGPTATMLTNGKVLIAGGDIGDGDGASVIAELYDPATGKFAATSNLTTGREQSATTLLPDGTVLFAGGHCLCVSVPGGGFDNLASAEIYNPVTGTFSSTGSMITGRDLLGATLLNSGKVLITGGNEYYPFSAAGRDPQHPTLAMAELYTPPVLVPGPVLFSLTGDGQGQGAIWNGITGLIVSPSNPAAAGDVRSMYTTSLFEGGAIPPRVAIGGQLAEILFFGDAPGYPGYFQVNFRVPNGVALGSAASVYLNYIGRSSNEVTIGVR